MNPGKYTSLRLIEKLAFSIAKILTGKKPSQGKIHLAEMYCGNIMDEIKELAEIIDTYRRCPFCNYTPGPRCWRHALYIHLIRSHFLDLEELASTCGSDV
ncbi:MAG: hypothetical protein QXP97_04425 [Desulfurococcus sp.]|jgi:hypothetical protein